MSMNTYPIKEKAAFYIDSTCAPYIILAGDISISYPLPESVRAMLETGYFDRAVFGTVSLEEFKRDNPGYDHLSKLLPDDYRNISIVADIFNNAGIEHMYVTEADVSVKTYTTDNGDEGIDTHIYDQKLLCLLPNRESSYFTAVYKSIDELVAEYKERLQGYLPEDFDFRKHVCSIEGTYFC